MPAETSDYEWSCEDVAAKLGSENPPRLVDCREPFEFEIARLEGAELIPMNDTPGRVDEYRGFDGPTVVYCHHGVRSLNVVAWLRGQGVEDVWSLAGGIDHWSLTVDPEIPRY